jgi:O-antigen/teichoic acid export membrane protein
MLRSLAGSHLLRLFSSAVIDQALLSATNFLVGLLLIRHTSDTDYGHYVLAFNTLLLVTSFQGALIGGPLAVLAPKKDAEAKRAMVTNLYGRLLRFCRVATPMLLITAILATVVLGLDREQAMLLAAFTLTTHAALEREYLRSALMLYARPNAVLGADAVYALLLLVTAALSVWLFSPAAPAALLGIGIASWVSTRLSHASFGHEPGWSETPAPNALAEVLPLGYWSAAGSATYWLFYQGYTYLTAIKLDVAAVAALAATRLLLMPVNLLATGVRQILMPTAAGWYREHGMQALLRKVALISLGLVVLMACYDVLLWLLRDWIIDTVLKKHIEQRDLLLAMWIVIFALAVVRDQIMMIFLVRERFRAMTMLTFSCALVSLGLSWWAMGRYGPVGSLIGLAGGELINLAGVVWLTGRQVRKDLAEEAASPQSG